MRRREFIAAFGGAVAWPLAARAQQPAMPVIGFLHPTSANVSEVQLRGFRLGLKDTGFVEGENIAIDYRWANGQYDQLPALAADLVRRKVAVIALVAPVSALAAKQATSSIPIVFAIGSDPVKDGIVESLNRPGGNITGATFFANLLDAKRLGLLHQLVPSAKVVAALLNPKNTNFELERQETQEAANALGLELVVLQASNEREIDNSFATIVEKNAGAVFVAGDAFLSTHGEQITKLAMSHSIPAAFVPREQAAAGGLMSYGGSIAGALRQAGAYVGRILKGEKPADLPVQQSTQFEFVINMKTAKTLGVQVPPSLLAIADEVIE
jgi:putative tryptophan/tyrosine transport system substrate-binding protein